MPEGCPERPGTELESEHGAKAVCTSGHPRAAGASCVLGERSGPPQLLLTTAPPAPLCQHNPWCNYSITWQGMTGTTNLGHSYARKRKGKKPLLFPNLSSQHGCPDSCPCVC